MEDGDKFEARLGYSVLGTGRGRVVMCSLLRRGLYFNEKPGLESQFSSQLSLLAPTLHSTDSCSPAGTQIVLTCYQHLEEAGTK